MGIPERTIGWQRGIERGMTYVVGGCFELLKLTISRVHNGYSDRHAASI
jgi:hypothetical protein